MPSITGLRISPHGAEATLINISTSGLLAECGERLQPGSSITVIVEGGFTPQSIAGRVARNSVSSMAPNGRLRYHVGICFNAPIDLGEEPVTEPSAVEPAVHASPLPAAVVIRNRW
jgi:hypothetical protein